jgi:micrococcal nuclease
MGVCNSKATRSNRSVDRVEEMVFEPRPPKLDDHHIEYKDTIEFVPPFNEGEVVKVYDGDTITIAAHLPYYEGSPLYRVNVRLLGIDAPEMKSKNKDEKDLAHKAQTALSDLIMGKKVTLRNTQNEKFGRLLADVYCEGIHLNEWIVEHRYAVSYNGGTKQPPANWFDYHTDGTLDDIYVNL